MEIISFLVVAVAIVLVYTIRIENQKNLAVYLYTNKVGVWGVSGVWGNLNIQIAFIQSHFTLQLL